MTAAAASSRIAEFWDQAIVPTLVEYIRIPAKSPHFDEEWRAHGHIEAAVGLAERWCRRYMVPGTKLEVMRLPGRTLYCSWRFPPRGRISKLSLSTATS